MSWRDPHVPTDRLTALALLPAEATSVTDRAALAHLASCDACGQALARLTADLDTLRGQANREADAYFSENVLSAQKARILDRIVHVGQSARVIAFPQRSGRRFVSGSNGNRRWITVAAAAGLVIGLLTGQVLQLAQVGRTPTLIGQPEQTARAEEPVFIRATARSLSEDELLDEIDLAVQQGRRAVELRALDALTPTISEIR